jgi:glutathione S-transferase
MGTHIHRWFNYPIERPDMPRLRAWYERCAERPGFKNHIVMPIT